MPTSQETNAPAGDVPADDEAAEPLPLQAHSPINLFLIVGSVALTVWTSFGSNVERLVPWLISLAPADSPERLIEVGHGEIWRLLTPAFLHFSVAHIGFNMLNLMSLGNILERRIGSWKYLLVASSIALVSDLGQYFVSDNQYFGGMSGVVYGLFGYVWLRGRYDSTFGLAAPPQMVILALVWFVLCFTGVLGSIANVAHTAGLVLGAIWGVADARGAMRAFHEQRPAVTP